MPAERILLIDDEAALREVLGHLFQRDGYEVRGAPSGEDGLDIYDAWQPNLVVTDLTMPGMDGLAVLREVKTRATKEGRDVPVLLITAYGTTAIAVQAMRDGAFDYVAKPFQNDELRMLVHKALAMRRLEDENARLRAELADRYQLGSLVGTSPRMQAVYAMVKRVMGTRINCLLYGESGTGKELVARAIHYGSERSKGPFVAVNCGAIPEALIESELFGYKKGAFTGASADKDGVFAAADGGTLFLDEIGEMPLAAQVKVLRAVQERRIVPVGDTAERTVDVRIVAATHRHLEAEVRAGRFREDLYYRLNVIQIDLPPLRDRAEDVPALLQHFITKFCKDYGKEIRGATPESIRLLRAYRFPGNVRELQNIVERAVALEAGPLITPSSLPERVQGDLHQDPAETDDEPFPQEGIDMEARLAAVERRYLERALQAAGGNRTQAAKMLGITFRSFRYRLVKFGMAAPDEVEV
jgi:two-component system response regulator PilR (NtrC family)